MAVSSSSNSSHCTLSTRARQLLSALRLFAARIALRFIALALKVEIAFDALPHVELRAQKKREE